MRYLLAVLILTLLAALPAAAELTLQTVRSDKIYYDPGSEAKFEVVVANPDDAAAPATLRVELVWDTALRRTLTEQPITVPAQGVHAWTGSLKLPTVLGMAVTATLLRNGRPFAEKSDYFTCARSVHQVLIFGRGNHGPWQFSGLIDPIRDTYPAEFAQQWRSTYGNCLEKFGWAPSDFDDLTPEEDRWWSGQTAYNECKSNMIAVIDALHAQGIKVVTYGKESAAGITGFERYRRRPDLAPYGSGRPWMENYSAAYLDWITALGPPHPGDPHMSPALPRKWSRRATPAPPGSPPLPLEAPTGAPSGMTAPTRRWRASASASWRVVPRCSASTGCALTVSSSPGACSSWTGPGICRPTPTWRSSTSS